MKTKTIFHLSGGHTVQPIKRPSYQEWIKYIRRETLKAIYPNQVPSIESVLVSGWDSEELRN